MMWLIAGLLFAIAFLLGWILLLLGQVAELIASLARYAAVNLNEAQHSRGSLERIERHSERMAKPFYDADADRRLNPSRYEYE